MTPQQRAGGPVVGLLLAAGRGTRFDPSGQRDKLLAEVSGRRVAERSALRLAQACDRVLAVVRPGAGALAEVLAAAGCEVVECPDAGSGMGHSLSFGAAEAVRRHRPRAIVVMLADMPFVEPDTIGRLVSALSDERAIAAPRFEGRRGNPVAFGARLFSELASLRGDRGAASLLSAHEVAFVDVADPGILRDVDSEADLDEAKHPPQS